MKTTVTLPDELFRRAKAWAALHGISMRQFLTEAVMEKLSPGRGRGSAAVGWRAVFGKAPIADIRKVNAVISEEFCRTDPADWT